MYDPDPYSEPPRHGSRAHRDPFRIPRRPNGLPGREPPPPSGGNEARIVPLPHGSPSDRQLPAARFLPRARGVYEQEADWPGTRAFLVVAENGDCLMDVTVRAPLATNRFIHSLWRFLEREDPRQLRAI